MEKGFVFLDDIIPYAQVDAKYYSDDNFTGANVDGYKVNKVVGTTEMALALVKASSFAQSKGFGLFFWDGYRPIRAVQQFMEWVMLPENGKTKQTHYPNVSKAQMLPLGYISPKSGHSRGSTIDLSLYKVSTGELLDMGGNFDFMDISSHHNAKGLSPIATANRLLLRSIMMKSGFIPYENEWWHYTLKNEPYPTTYFDFVIQ